MKKSRILTAFGGLLILFVACSRDRAGGDSETHWMKQCATDSDCEGTATCSCGVCTKECSSPSDCSTPGNRTTCAPSDDVPSCGASAAPARICLASCSGPSDCAPGFECSSSGCTPAHSGASGGGGSGGRPASSAGDNGEPSAGQIGGPSTDSGGEPGMGEGGEPTVGDTGGAPIGTGGTGGGPSNAGGSPGGVGGAPPDPGDFPAGSGGASCKRNRGGGAGARALPQSAPADGVTCPSELDGFEVCAPSSQQDPPESIVLSRCVAGTWVTVDASSDCTLPQNWRYDCNEPGASDGVCCEDVRYCADIGLCDGSRWWTEGVSLCGNGVRERNEACDDGNLSPYDACLDDCRLPFCGDGLQQPPPIRDEECDDGPDNGPAPARCSLGCTLN